jgi:serine/threonine protein kinase
MSVTQAVTGIIVGCIIGGLLILVAYVKIYRNVFFKPKSKKSVKTIKRRAFSVGGNLVKELVIPISDVYEITKTLLGSGSSAEVVIGTHLKTQRRYAVKIIDITKSEVAWRYEREKNYLRDIDHTNVVRLYEVYTSPVALFFVMELCTGGHLGQIMKKQKEGRLDEITARRYILQITRAIHHCHKNGICHRDIKLQNILLENNTKDAQIKLVDFGNAARYKGE